MEVKVGKVSKINSDSFEIAGYSRRIQIRGFVFLEKGQPGNEIFKLRRAKLNIGDEIEIKNMEPDKHESGLIIADVYFNGNNNKDL